MQMDLTSINSSLSVLSKKISNYLNNPSNIDLATYEQQLDTKYVSNKYNEIVQEYSNLLSLITESQFFISQCKKIIRLLSNSTVLEQTQKTKLKTVIDTVNEMIEPLYNEKERLKTIEMFYRNIYTRREF